MNGQSSVLKRSCRCGHAAQVNGREFKCPKCGLVYNKYSPCLNERHGMGSLALNRQMKDGVKPQLNAGSSQL